MFGYRSDDAFSFYKLNQTPYFNSGILKHELNEGNINLFLFLQNVFFSRLPPALAVTHRVNLTVGKISVIGEGPIPRAARHAAARLALEELRKQMMEDEASKGLYIYSNFDFSNV